MRIAALFLTVLFAIIHPLSAEGEKLLKYEEELLHRINEYRIDSGLPALTFDPELRSLTERHSQYMQRTGSLNHDNFNRRFNESKRSCCVENVGWNHATPEEQLHAWQRSDGHNMNLLNRKIKGAAIAKAGAYVTFFACE
jgi:uncharacterized protein YkwD